MALGTGIEAAKRAQSQPRPSGTNTESSMNRRLLDIALKMSLHLLTLLEEDTAEYSIIEQQAEIL